MIPMPSPTGQEVILAEITVKKNTIPTPKRADGRRRAKSLLEKKYTTCPIQ